MKNSILVFLLLSMIATGFFQFHLSSMTFGTFTWGAVGYSSQVISLVLIGLLTLKIKAEVKFKLIYLVTFFALMVLIQFWYLKVSVLLAALLLITSIFYLTSLLWLRKAQYVVASIYLSLVSFYVLSVVIFPIIIYFEIAPIIWDDKDLLVSRFLSLGENFEFFLYGAGPSIMAVTLGYFVENRT